MLSFIRKRLPSRDRSHENHDEQLGKSQSVNELRSNDEKKKKKKAKKKNKSSSIADNLHLNSSSPSNEINKSYSDVDYLPLMPGILPKSDDNNDSYLNPPEDLQNKVFKPHIPQIPMSDCRRDQKSNNYNDLDHQKTKALRHVTEHRMQKRLFH